MHNIVHRTSHTFCNDVQSKVGVMISHGPSQPRIWKENKSLPGCPEWVKRNRKNKSIPKGREKWERGGITLLRCTEMQPVVDGWLVQKGRVWRRQIYLPQESRCFFEIVLRPNCSSQNTIIWTSWYRQHLKQMYQIGIVYCLYVFLDCKRALKLTV